MKVSGGGTECCDLFSSFTLMSELVAVRGTVEQLRWGVGVMWEGRMENKQHKSESFVCGIFGMFH